MFVTNWISTTKIQKISEITNFFRHYFLSRTEVYLGLGFGRLVPKNRIGCRFELGCQFMGKLKVYQNGNEIDINKALEDAGEDDLSKFVKDLKVYPVLKFSLTGRIL
ncbi:hypothetical protein [Segatella copri]|uniref:Uncharacterized protein n=1 Tax=Segatella copri TaxID=165179 RepID=A0AA90UUG7_9BACT|nr:hypothetical protein [Segatella copri]MQN82601.1 hypothetical protein [Segatella copri]